MKTDELVIAVLPEGLKDMGDVFESQEFKKFMSEQVKPKPMFIGIPSSRDLMFGQIGEGKSYLSEYLKTLPQINLENDISKYKNRTIVAFVK
jgi:hypothetical protein